MFADPDFNIQLHVSQLNVAISNIVQEGYTLAEPSLAANGENIPIQGLVGVDILQFIPKLQITKCMLGFAWITPLGLVPFGNVINFLYPVTPISSNDQASPSPRLEYKVVIPIENHMTATHVNFVLSPKKSYFTPLESLCPDSTVEQGLENMFSLDSLACRKESEQSSLYDSTKTEEFQRGIVLRDNKYYVNLPWKEDLIDKVPSNHKLLSLFCTE